MPLLGEDAVPIIRTLGKRGRNLMIGIAIAILCGAGVAAAGLSNAAIATAAITGLCAGWWVLEPIPIPVTSLIPFAAFPLCGVVSHKQVATAYGDSMILLLMGGFMLSTAIEHTGVHRRLALGMVRLTGNSGRRVVLGFMIASAVCSMWISNTATVLMLLPVALAVTETEDGAKLAIPLLLGIAYAASIGGMGTPIGTPPNVIFMKIYEDHTGNAISFVRWMTIAVPIVIVLVPITWVFVSRYLKDVQAPAMPTTGSWSTAEKRVLIVFAFTAAAWVFRKEPFGGWSGLFDITTAGDSTVALAAVVVLFLIPNGEDGALLTWEKAKGIPWGLLLLFGGGIAISQAFKASGLSAELGAALTGLKTLPTIGIIFFICLSVTFMTEITSNTATTALLMPILAAAAIAARVDPTVFMVPAAISASCAFMLPVATAPNAIVSGAGVPTARMAREGIVLNLIGAAVISLLCWLTL